MSHDNLRLSGVLLTSSIASTGPDAPGTQSIQLNPILEHRNRGPPPLDWDMRDEPSSAVYLSTYVPASPPDVDLFELPGSNPPLQTHSDGEVPTVLNFPSVLPRPSRPLFDGIPRLDRVRPTPDYPMSPLTFPLAPSDWAQPATHPYLDTMRIIAVGEDPSLSFAWPVTITNPRGILVEDVLRGIYVNFQELVTREEYESWEGLARDVTNTAFERRLALLSQRPPPQDDSDRPSVDAVQRVDWLGERFMFRGLERDEEGDWILFVGPGY